VLKLFDRKFGARFAASIPLEPGVYRIYAADGALVYVGKAKSLRRRLSQYRNARRCKAHAKMRAILADGERIELDTCESHLEACLLETRLIQQHRPRWNVAGAFHFLYPMLGMYAAGSFVYFCYTTSPEKFPEFSLHGAYRSREITADAFFALTKLLEWVGHPLPRSQLNGPAGLGGRDRYSHVVGFRRLDERWYGLLSEFWRGRSRAAVAELILALVEKPSARRSPQQIQEAIDSLKRFWRHEASPLHRVTRDTATATWPVPQQERDPLFLQYRLRRKEGQRAVPLARAVEE